MSTALDRFEPAARLLTFLTAHALPPQATAVSILDQAEAQQRDAGDDAWSIAIVILAKAVLDARRAFDAGEDTDVLIDTVGIALRLARNIGPARSMIPPGDEVADSELRRGRAPEVP